MTSSTLQTLPDITRVARAVEELADALELIVRSPVAHVSDTDYDGLAKAAARLSDRCAHARSSPSPRRGVWRRVGDHWEVGIDGTTSIVADSKGVIDIATLIATPRRDTSVADLAAITLEPDVGPTMDTQMRRSLEERIIELQAIAVEADQHHDLGRLEQSHCEIDELVDQLSHAYGISGRSRPQCDSIERARSTVTARIRAAIRRLYDIDRPLAAHLERSVKTGRWCSYHPESDVRWLHSLPSPSSTDTATITHLDAAIP